MKNKVLSLLVIAARLRPVKPLISFFYHHMNNFLPIDRLCEGTYWMAFHHPRPDYALHILIIPKQAISSLSDAPSGDPSLYADLFKVVQQLISDFKLEHSAYRLVTNGGQNQLVPVWHWHLVYEASSKDMDNPGVPHD